jgi:hypothetical protein
VVLAIATTKQEIAYYFLYFIFFSFVATLQKRCNKIIISIIIISIIISIIIDPSCYPSAIISLLVFH